MLGIALILAQSTVQVPTPQANSVWDYALLAFCTGGGAIVIPKTIEAWQGWRKTRHEFSRELKLDNQSAAENVIIMLKKQIDDQVEDYEARLDRQESFYKEETENRKALYLATLNDFKEQLNEAMETIKELRQANLKLIIELQNCETNSQNWNHTFESLSNDKENLKVTIDEEGV